MTKYLPLLISGLIGITAMNGCGKTKLTPLEERLNLAVQQSEYLQSGFTALHSLNKDDLSVVGSLLSGNGMYVIFHDLDLNGKLGLNDYCSVNESKPCAESPYWGVPQLNNLDRCSVNVCSTHYPNTLSSMKPIAVKPAVSPDSELQMYTTEEFKGMKSVAQMTAEQIKNCPRVCATYFGGSKILLFDDSVIREK